MSGKWTQSGGQSFAYVVKNADSGFSIATFASSGSSGTLTWQGNKWTSAGSTGVLFDNTVFTPSDLAGTGLSQLLYSSATNIQSLGFSTGEQTNDGVSGHSFVWGGTKFTTSLFALDAVRFIPGYWSGAGREGWAYVDMRADGGWDISMENLDASGNPHYLGDWFQSPSAVQYKNTGLIPADTNNDGYTDLYYANANAAGTGFDMAIAYNNTIGTALVYGSQQWDQTGLTLPGTLFIPEF